MENTEHVNYFQYASNLMTIRACDHWNNGSYSQTASSRDAEGLEQQTNELDDTFGLEFAAVQWLNLVTNAEQLFNKLLGK